MDTQEHARKFWLKVDQSGGPDACWPWKLSCFKTTGYGQAVVDGGHDTAHTFAYYFTYGPVPAEMTIDHECHTRDSTCAGGKTCLHRKCCNPRHLVLKTNKENVLAGRGPTAENARKTHCKKGHALTEDNIYLVKKKDGHIERWCRICHMEKSREYYWRKKAEKEKAAH
jgi:hypothetical protein